MAIGLPWLPAGASFPVALEARLSGVVESWSGRWFASVPMTLATPSRTISSDLSWRGLDSGLMLGMTPDASIKVGARMLGVASGDRAERDRSLLEEVAEACLLDLRTALGQIVGAPQQAEWRSVALSPGWTARIGGTVGSLAVALTDTLFATLTSRVLPPVDVPPLGSGTDALAAIKVSVGAAIGSAALSVGDLQALGLGDVIVLDQAIADSVAIAVDGRALARGRVRVVAADPHPFLQVVNAAA